MQGTATRVRCSGGIPREKSNRGIARGGTIKVQSQLTMPTANWLAVPASNTNTTRLAQERRSARLPGAIPGLPRPQR